MKHKILAAILVMNTCLGFFGCTVRTNREAPLAKQTTKDTPSASAPSTTAADERQRGYLARFTNQVMFIQFVDDDGRLSGQFQIAQTDNAAAVSSQNFPFTGTRKGKDVSITLTGNVWTTGWTAKTFTGTLSGNQLTLVTPGDDGKLITVVLKDASVDDYNQAVTAVKQAAVQQLQAQQAALAAAKAAQDAADERARQQRAVASANDEIARALLRLAGDRDSLADDPRFAGVFKTQQGILDQMQTQFTEIQQQSAKRLTCYQRNQLEYEVNQIEYELNQIEYQVNQAAYIKSGVDDRLSAVRDDIQQVQRAWEKLAVAVKANTNGTPAPEYTADDIQAAITAANHRVAAASEALQQLISKADDYYNQGEELLGRARDLVSKVRCSD